eukprot:757099-Hanusia_phi.AAC.3
MESGILELRYDCVFLPVSSVMPGLQLAKRNLALLKGLTNEDEKEIESCKLFSFKTAQMIKPEEITWSLGCRESLVTTDMSVMGIEEDKLLNFLQKVRRSCVINYMNRFIVLNCQNEQIPRRESFSQLVRTSNSLIPCSSNAFRILGMKEKLSVLIACLTHDLSHPGVNSDFLIKSASPIALQFPFSNVIPPFLSCLLPRLIGRPTPGP